MAWREFITGGTICGLAGRSALAELYGDRLRSPNGSMHAWVGNRAIRLGWILLSGRECLLDYQLYALGHQLCKLGHQLRVLGHQLHALEVLTHAHAHVQVGVTICIACLAWPFDGACAKASREPFKDKVSGLLGAFATELCLGRVMSRQSHVRAEPALRSPGPARIMEPPAVLTCHACITRQRCPPCTCALQVPLRGDEGAHEWRPP